MAQPKRILLIRLSSIGDIVLTTPLLRCLRQQMPDCEIHYLTKKSFFGVLEHNPHIAQVHDYEEELATNFAGLSFLNFDFVADLHKNLRSKKVVRSLGVASSTFSKHNIEKWLLVNFKVDRMPNKHIVERYFEALQELDVVNDSGGLEYFIQANDREAVEQLPAGFKGEYLAWVVGAAHATKAMPVDKSIAVLQKIDRPIVLLGGPADVEKALEIEEGLDNKNTYNAVGKTNLNESAALLEAAAKIITPDTGMMHIAAAFQQNIAVVWGNTVPAFGMGPYRSSGNVLLSEVKDLKCRPCSKIGYNECPKKHFNCMQMQDDDVLSSWANS